MKRTNTFLFLLVLSCGGAKSAGVSKDATPTYEMDQQIRRPKPPVFEDHIKPVVFDRENHERELREELEEKLRAEQEAEQSTGWWSKVKGWGSSAASAAGSALDGLDEAATKINSTAEKIDNITTAVDNTKEAGSKLSNSASKLGNSLGFSGNKKENNVEYGPANKPAGYKDDTATFEDHVDGQYDDSRTWFWVDKDQQWYPAEGGYVYYNNQWVVVKDFDLWG